MKKFVKWFAWLGFVVGLGMIALYQDGGCESEEITLELDE
jgi:hypothetical protein